MAWINPRERGPRTVCTGPKTRKNNMGMLVLSRRVDEKILIGEGDNLIVIQVVLINSGQVRLGIEAPNGVRILREEILERTKEP